MRRLTALALLALTIPAAALLPDDPRFTVTLEPTYVGGSGSYGAADVDAVQIFCNSGPDAAAPTSVSTTPRLEVTTVDAQTFPDVVIQSAPADFPPNTYACAARAIVGGRASPLSEGVTFETFDPTPAAPGNLTVE